MMQLVNFLIHPSTLAIVGHMIFVVAISLRIIMKRPAIGVALAWLILVSILPYVGAAIYFAIGERRINGSRVRGIQNLQAKYARIFELATRAGLTDVDWSRHDSAAEGMNRLGTTTSGFATVQGSEFQMFSETEEMLESIARDVESAQTSVLMEFYIWNEGGKADEVLEAVVRAAERGVSCRLLIDHLGARPWWNGKQPQRLRDAGVEIRPALTVGIFRAIVGRLDLRLHRKIVVIDGKIAWTGSMNLVDPRFFKQDSGVGEWVDAMVRLQGAVVAPLAGTMIGDWILETDEEIEDIIASAGLTLVEPKGNADIQVIPSGPGQTTDGLLQMILALINSAQHELILTTPYMVPDESLLRAIRGAAGRGVQVKLIVPQLVDSFLARYASRSYFEDLLETGVEIHLFHGGLLHTKSILVDNSISMFGTVNLDMRSLWINYEVSLFVYDNDFAQQLKNLQQVYLDKSIRLVEAEWKLRPFKNRILENTLRLISPLL